MKIRSPFDGLRMPSELACEFFAVFSRFEFTLKETLFVIPGRQRAEPDWRRFGCHAAVKVEVGPSSDLEAAIAYLNENPPQVQTRENGWQPLALYGDTATARAIDAACRVRHNLFHGGKHTLTSADGRDEQLVRCAMTVLVACLEQDDDFRATFEQTEF